MMLRPITHTVKKSSSHRLQVAVARFRFLCGRFYLLVAVFVAVACGPCAATYPKRLNSHIPVATKDHSKTSCICVTILTHGDKGGEVHAADRPYLLTDIIAIFEKQRSLVNKPKLFFVQACRGGNMDAGNTVSLDSHSDSVLTVPTHADFLLLCSTVDDYLSYRDMNGSWMVQALCHIIQHHYEELDLLHMITLMNRLVAYEKSTYTPSNRAMNNKKQMPETRFTLTKLLKF